MVKPCIKQSKRRDHHKWFSKALSFVAKIATLGVLSMSLHLNLFMQEENHKGKMTTEQLFKPLGGVKDPVVSLFQQKTTPPTSFLLSDGF